MSFTIPHPPSASSDSGSSASLTPTAANGYTSNTGFSDPSSSASASAAPASGSLFSSEESKFITDSLSSAESFDPFTIGAPGFKVPSLLPPNIAATHDHLTSQASAAPSASAGGASSDSGPGPDLRLRSLSGQQSYPLGYSTSSPGQQGTDAYGNAAAAHRLNSFNLYGHRTGATPPAGPSNTSSPSYFSHLHDSFPYGSGRHASFSGASNLPLSPGAAAGYGKNKAWQMEQLSFLEAQANRGQQQQTQQSPFASAVPHHIGVQNDHHRRSSTSMIGRPSPYENLFFGTPAHLQQQQQQQQAQLMEQQQHRPPFYPGMEEHQAGLAMLGAQFPSSHNFGSLQHQQQQGSMQAQHQQLPQQQGLRGANGLPGGFSAQALAMLNGDAGLGAISSIVASESDAAGVSTPKGRTSRTPTANESGSAKAGRGAAAFSAAAASASPSGSPAGTKRMSTGAPKTAPTQGSSLNTGPSGAVIRALGDLANLDLDLEGALRALPAHLHPYFTPSQMEKRTQPHLEMLREQHVSDGLIDPTTGLEIKPEPTEESLKRDAEEAEREKKQHTLLTTEEKKANHIASEQKRRANIRKGYELLCDIVPSLREALEREATSKKRDSDDESEDEDKGKKKKPGVGKKADESGGGGIEIDGEKIDGRAGPRSEAVVLMKSLDHIGALVEQYRGLLGRRNRARVAVAKKMGWDGLANQPVGDVDRLLAIKVQDWWASHVDGEEEGEGEDRFGVGGEEAEEDEGAGAEMDEEAADAEEVKGKKKTKAKKPAQGKKKKAGKTEEDDGMHD
ncbi:Transcription factor [Pseudozyma hubeiensis]|nr:Transcription factor [Pseudozyma hubeiensis]